MTLNGALAGLVAITAPCATVTPCSAIIIGAIAGVLVVLSVLFFDSIKIDDPVGAVSVHGVCGAWGTLSAGIFNIGGTSATIIGVQCLGVGDGLRMGFRLAASSSSSLIDAVLGLRVIGAGRNGRSGLREHGATAYPDFQISSNVVNLLTSPCGRWSPHEEA